MLKLSVPLLLLMPLALLTAAGIAEELAVGAQLTPAQAAALEGKAAITDCQHLLGWYTAHPAPEHRDKRVALILALAQQGALGRLATHTAARITREGDSPLASPEGYAKVKAALIDRAEKTKIPVDRSNAAWFIFPEEPDIAIGMGAENGLLYDTGVMAAQYLLGMIHPDGRSSPFGRSLRQLVAETPDALFQYAFGDTLRDLGARRYAAGESQWDYSTLANESLARAAKAEPQQATCGFDPAVLPAKGVTVPESAPEPVPPGAVSFHALIGCSGYAVVVEWIDGPAAQLSAAKRELATRQFEVPRHAGQPRQLLIEVAAGAAAKSR